MGIDTDKAEIDNALAWAAKALHRECYGADEGTRREALREALTRTLARARAEGFRAAKERAAASWRFVRVIGFIVSLRGVALMNVQYTMRFALSSR
jgi:hypothetical protein